MPHRSPHARRLTPIAATLAAAVLLGLPGCGSDDNTPNVITLPPAEPEVTLDDFMLPLSTPGEWQTPETAYDSPQDVWQDVLQYEKANDMAALLAVTSIDSRIDYLPALIVLLDDLPKFDVYGSPAVDALVDKYLGEHFDVAIYAETARDHFDNDHDAWTQLADRTAAMLAQPDAFMAEAMVLYNNSSQGTSYAYDLGAMLDLEIDEDYAAADFQAISTGSIRAFERELVEFVKDDEGWLMILGGAW